MPEGAQKAPDQWDQFEDRVKKWESIEMREVVYSDLDRRVTDVLRTILGAAEIRGDDLERVEKIDAETIELVYLDNWEGERPAPYSDKLNRSEVRTIRDKVQSLFGDHWRVYRKEVASKGRYGPSKVREHPQRLIVKRADHQRFRYSDESESEYLAALHGRPDGVPEDAIKWADMVEEYPMPRPGDRGMAQDIYVFESHTGTRHIVRGVSLRDGYVFEGVSCQCGHEIDREIIAEAEQIEHYATTLMRLDDEIDVGDLSSLDPQMILNSDPDNEDSLCGRCWKRYAIKKTNRAGDVIGYKTPILSYGDLLKWDHDLWAPGVTDDG